MNIRSVFSTTRIQIVIVLLMAFSASCSKDAKKDSSDAGLPPVLVEVQTVSKADVSRVLRYSGDIEAQSEIRLFSSIMDRIQDLKVAEGDKVKSGDIVAVIRSSGLNETVTQARSGLDAMVANVEGLKDQYARQERLRASGVIPEAQIEATRTQLAAAEAQVRQLEATTGLAQIRKTDAIVRAPISGIIGKLFLKVGDLAGPGIPIGTIVQMDRVKVSFDVPSNELELIRTDMPVDIQVDALGSTPFQGRVTYVSPTIDLLSRTAKVEVGLDNANHVLKPGMLARVSIEVDRHTGVVAAPLDGLLLDPRPEGMGYRGFVLKGSQAEERKLQVGFQNQGLIEVTAGLAEGDVLIVKGQHLLQDGTKVEVQKPAAPAAKE